MSARSEPSFFTDMGRALRAWGRFPWLPLVSLVLMAAMQLTGPLAILGVVATVLYAGWIGTERIVYLRAFRSQGTSGSELWRLTWSFVLRYVILGLAVGMLYLPIGVLAATGLLREPGNQAWVIAVYAVTVPVDMALTFVTAALAFSTRRVGRAVRMGLRMIRSEWPAAAWYVLLPPMAVLVASATLARTDAMAVGGQLSFLFLATLLNLAFKGGIAAFYLRRYEVDDTGSAFFSLHPEPAPRLSNPDPQEGEGHE